MTRSRASAKKAGSNFERSEADYFQANGFKHADRRVKTGANDKGDIGGVETTTGEKLVIECKDYGGEIKAGTWIKEAHTEAINDGAPAGVVIIKRRGTTAPGQQWALMTVDDLLVLLGQERPAPLVKK